MYLLPITYCSSLVERTDTAILLFNCLFFSFDKKNVTRWHAYHFMIQDKRTLECPGAEGTGRAFVQMELASWMAGW